jgi:capsular exopolysaccharide synthesis family protein
MIDEKPGPAGAALVPGHGNQQAGAGPWSEVPPEDVEFVVTGEVRASRVPILEAFADPSSIVGEELRLISARIQDLSRQRGARCLALTSPLPGEGKSTLSLGLAAALARQPGRRVLLLEVDLRRPSLTQALGLPPSAGLGEWLHARVGKIPLRVVEPFGFSVLVAGQAELEQPEILGSRRMESLLRVARSQFDIVVLDAMPLVPVTDATIMQDLVDGFILVVRHRATPRDAVQQGLAKLHPGRVLGVVMNDYREILPTYTTYAYRRYGMAYGPSKRAKDPSDGSGE